LLRLHVFQDLLCADAVKRKRKMTWTKRLTIAAAALAAVVITGAAQAATITINFGVITIGGTPSYTGTSLDQSTAFDFGTGTFIVNQIGAGDQSTLALGNLVALTNPNYGSGNVGSLSGDMTKSWTTNAGTFTETLTSFIINRGTPDAITLLLAGTLTGPGGISQDAFAIVNANQVGGPGNAVNWSLTDTSTLGATPLPAALPLFATGLGALGLLARRRKRKAVAVA
jgi:hypothetical protein